MSVKAKTRKRLVLLVAAVVGIGCAGGGLYAVKQYRAKARFAEQRALGMKAAAEGKSEAVAQHLGYWLAGNPDDVEALRLYVEHRLQTEHPENQNVWDAIKRLRHLVELQPDDVAARRQLMLLYAKHGFGTEAMEAADVVLAKQPKDVEAMRVRVQALGRQRKLEDALGAAEKWAKATPSDPEPVLIVLELMKQMERPESEILDRAKAAAGDKPDAPESQLILGWAYAVTDQLPQSHDLLKKAAAQKHSSVAFTRQLIAQMNRTGLYQDSLELLERLAKDAPEDLDVRRALVRRMWELNRAQDVIALTEPDGTKLGHEAVAFRAMALMMVGKAEDAKQTLSKLPVGSGDSLADAWSAIVAYEREPASTDSRKLLKLCQTAATKDSEGGYLRYYMGQAYAQLDEGELAIDMWQRLSAVNTTWYLPLVRLSELRLAKGRPAMAMQAAQMALFRAPRSPMAAVNLARVWSANVEASEGERPEQLFKLIADIRKAMPQEESTLAMQVSLLAGSGRKDQAKAEITAALSGDRAPSEAVLLRLAAVSQQHGLSVEEACFDRAEKAHGVSPNLAFARAMHKFGQDAGAEGLALLKAAREKSGKPDELGWQLAWARYLEVTRDPAAKDEWTRLADARPEDRQIQQVVLDVPSVRSDRAFIDRSIERLRKLTGDEGVKWKVARARWILDGAKTDQDLTQATLLLKDVVRMTEDAEPRFLLATAYDRLNNPAGAIEQLRAASAADPSNSRISLYLSQLLQKRGEHEQAREELDRVAKGKSTGTAERRQAAALLAQQGDTQRAIELLQQQDGAGGDQLGGDRLLLAMLYRQRNELAKADAEVKKLLANPDPAVVQFAADLYAQQGRRADADQALAMLDKLQLKPGMKELLLADHATRHQTPERAIELFRASLKAAPENASGWRSLVGYYTHLGRGKEAAAAAAEGLSKVPADPVLKEIVAQKQVLAEAAGDAELRVLAVAFLSDPRRDGPSLAALDVVLKARQSGERPDVVAGKLRKIVEANPTFAPLQAILIKRYISMNRGDDAVALASRAVQMFPGDPQTAQLAVEAAIASRRWAEALGFARTWRERAVANPLPADLAIATCLQQTGQARQAAEVLAPHIPQALSDPDKGAVVIYPYATALVKSGERQKAAEVLWPLAQKSGEWRKAWMQLATSMPPAQWSAWLDRVESIVPADAQDEQTVLAGIWHGLGTATKDPALLAKAEAVFAKLMARPDIQPQTWLTRGMTAEGSGDLATAETAYRRVLEAEPKSIVALNNLAMVIVKRNGDASEAVGLAKRAVEAQPNAPTLHDTLALVQAKAKDVDGAVASLRKALDLDPESLEWRVHLGRILLDGGRAKDAEKVVAEIAALPAGRTPPSPETLNELERLRADVASKSSASAQ